MRHFRIGLAFAIVLLMAWLPMERAHANTFEGWVTSGLANNTGSCIQFSYMQGTATKTVAVNSEVSGATFSVTIDNSITNTIGRPEPTADNYSMSLVLVADGATVASASLNESTIHGPEARTITATYAGRVDSAILTIGGIDRGFWGGWYGPTFCGPTFSWDASAVPSPSVSPTPEPSPSPAPSDTSTPVVEPTPTISPSPSPEPPQSSPEPQPSQPSVETPNASSSPEPTSSPEPSPTQTPTPSQSPSPTPPQVQSVNGSTNEGGSLTLSAPIGKIFTSVLFASYGTPNGYSIGQCHAPSSIEKVAEIFLGKAIATIMALNDIFGDPCGGTYKSLAVSLIYGDDPQAPEPSPSPSPSPSSDTPTVVNPSPEPSVVASPSQSPNPTPEPSVTTSPQPEPTLEPSPSPSPTPLPPVVEPPRPQPTQEPAPSTPEPTPSPSASPEPSPTPSPDVSPTPDETPTPEPSPEPSPSEPSPTPTPEPSPEPSPSPSPQPSVSPAPETPEPEPTPPVEVPSDSPLLDVKTEAIVDSALADGKLTEAEKELIADAVIEQFAGEPVPVSALAEAGITYADLPPETPVEVRTDAEGNPIVITAEVADALELVSNAADLVGALFSDPGKALMAFANIGADMSPVERKESQQVVVASIIVASIATLSIRRI